MSSSVNHDLNSKMEAFARVIEGKVVHDENRVQVCIKGTVLGFPATLEAISAGFPFGVTYFVETQVIDDPNRVEKIDPLDMTVCPRYVRGIFGFLARIFLIEPKGQKLDDKRMESYFVSAYNNSEEAHRFVRYPGVVDTLLKLEEYSKFTELRVRAGHGLVLSQPKNFHSLDPDVFRETFRLLAELGQVLFEAF